MLNKINDRINCHLSKYIASLDKRYSMSKVSPALSSNIRDFVLRKGKRIRPALFIIGYLGFVKNPAGGLYTSALSMELLHDFFLVHDDIIDKSDTRRGRPSMHKMLNNYLAKYKNLKFNGEDLSIVVGDVMYAMALEVFLSIKEDLKRKENALKKFIQTTLYTASGEFVELLYGAEDIARITKEDIYKIYDLKTANYTFSSPLVIGATLAGAGEEQTNKLFKYGTYLGRAFQIKDDILGIFGNEAKIGKSTLTDLQEAKKTILIWYAYNNSSKEDKTTIKNILSKRNVNRTDLLKIRKIIIKSGTLDYAKREIACLLEKAQTINAASKMRRQYKNFLYRYSLKIIN